MILVLFKKNGNKILTDKSKEKTVLKVKTVDDIPVIKEVRRMIGNNQRREAIIYSYSNLKKDYSRYFGAPDYNSNHDFIIAELENLGVKFDREESLTDKTDNVVIKTVIEKSKYSGKATTDEPGEKPATAENNRFYAIKKIGLFYFNFYEVARFGNYNWEEMDEKELINPVKDVYNYMDLMKLFYNGEYSGN